MSWDNMEHVMITKTRYLNKLLRFMQIRMKNKFDTKAAKLDVLKFMWSQRLMLWFQIAINMKDEGIKTLFQRIIKVKPEI